MAYSLSDEGHCTRPPLVLLDECDILNAVAEIISNSDKKTSEDDAWQTPLKQYLHTMYARRFHSRTRFAHERVILVLEGLKS